jgi:DNA-binding NarL/FixJ family response regulator
MIAQQTNQPVRMLVADDHPIVRAGIKTVLESYGSWTVNLEAADGEQALRLARLRRPDLAVLDYSLPVRSGLEVARVLKEELPQIRLLLYTMHSDARLLSELERIGVEGFVLKNEEDEMLLAAVKAILAGRRYYSQHSGASVHQDAEPSALLESLTAREQELVRLVATGYTNLNIAAAWGVSVKTVEAHRTSAMKKLNVHNAVGLAKFAIRNKLVEP